MKKYEPELGQMVGGQPYKKYGCSFAVESALKAIKMEMIITKNGYEDGYTPFDNAGMRFKNKVFEANSYDWNEDNEQPFNFKWSDFEVSWYKYLGRGMSQNRKISNKELSQMTFECTESLKHKR